MKRLFNTIYVAGILYGIFTIIISLKAGGSVNDFWIKNLLYISVAHVILLFALAWLIEKTPSTGGKIQTAGYLHTIIGFILAVIRLQQQDLVLEAIFIPIGSALSTSLLGWFLGGLIPDAEPILPEMKIRSEADKLAAELSGFSLIIKKLQNDYVVNLTEANEQFEKLYKKQEAMYLSADRTVESLKKNSQKLVENLMEAVTPMEASVKAISEALKTTSGEVKRHLGDDFTKTLQNMNAQFKQLNENTERANVSAQDVAKYLRETRVLIEELERLFDLVIREKSKI